MEASADTRLIRRARRLEYFTIAFNSLEGFIAVWAGFSAGSLILIAFGLDNLIEVALGLTLLWRLHVDQDEARRKRAEAITLRVGGICFIAIALYIADDAVTSLLHRGHYEPAARSNTGILLAAVSVIVTPFLARAKREAAAEMRSAAMVSDAKQTNLQIYLSMVVLGGLLLNALSGWWWADPAAALAMVPFLIMEGVVALQGERL